MENLIVSTLKASGYGAATDKVFIQSFSNATIQSVNAKQNAAGETTNLILLGAAVTINGPGGSKIFLMGTLDGQGIPLDQLAQYADGVGVVVNYPGYDVTKEFVDAAHAAGLLVHLWTFGDPNAATAIPDYWKYYAMGVDGLFTNYTDLAVQALATVPGPGGLGLLALGLAGIAVARRRKAA